MEEFAQKKLNEILRTFQEYGGFTLRPIKTASDHFYQIPDLYRDCESTIKMIREIGNGLVDPNYPELYDIQFSSLDGYSFTLGVPPSYDPNRDYTVPNEIYGVRDPSSEERQNQVCKGRRFYLPRQVKQYQRRSLEFWIENDKSLSDLRSKYPHLVTKPVWGKMTSREGLGVIIYFYEKKRKRFYDTLIGMEFLEKLKRQATGHNFQGKWHQIGRLLQLGGSGYLTYQTILEMYPSKRSRQSLLALGENYIKRTYLVLNANPPKEKQRKRGYSDKGSRKLSHQNHEPKTVRMEVYTANRGELEATNQQDLITLYLNGGLMPRRSYRPSGDYDINTQEIWKENNQRINEIKPER